MASYQTALDAPPRFQFEVSSGTLNASQRFNCGPTVMSFIAGYYRNYTYSIEATRKLVTGCCQVTTYSQQALMLARRGVPASVTVLSSIAQMRTLLADGRRPYGIGVYMARVPYSVRDHSFTGWHEIAVLSTAVRSGVLGFIVNDPNFSPIGGYRSDPDRGHKFYSEAVMQNAFLNYGTPVAVLPNVPKAVVASTPVPPITSAPMEGFPVRFLATPGKKGVFRGDKGAVEIRTAPDLTTASKWFSAKYPTTVPLLGKTQGAVKYGSKVWFVYWIATTSTSDKFDGRLAYVHSGDMVMYDL
jgi:hypothetical protein